MQMKNFLKLNWLFLLILVLSCVFFFWGVKFIPFHPDEISYLYMSSDFDTLISDPTIMRWEYSKESDPKQRYRELDPPLTKYLLGLGLYISGPQPPEKDWDWVITWEDNITSNRYPDTKILKIGRITVTALLPLSLIFIYLIGTELKVKWTGLIASILLVTNAVVLLHGRRSMAEGTLLFGVIFAAWSILKADKKPWLTGLGLAVAVNAKLSAVGLFPAAFLALIWLPGNTKNKGRKIISNLILFSLVFILIFVILNPLYWGNPIQAAKFSYKARTQLVQQQVSDMKSIAPEKVLDTPIKRISALFLNLYISPPEYGLVANLAPTINDVEGYIAIPGHNLFRGIIFGSIFFVLTIFGIYVAIRSISRKDMESKRILSLLLFCTLSQSAFILIAVPLIWIRYSIPLIPFITLWIAYGISVLLSMKSAEKTQDTPLT